MLTSLRAGLARLSYLPRALRLVWDAAPGWTAAWGALLALQGFLPVATVYVTKLLVNSLVATVGAGASWGSVRPTVLLAVLMAGLTLASTLLGLAIGWIKTAQGELVRDHLRGLIHDRAYRADLAFYESSDYHDHLSRARGDASREPLALLDGLGLMGQNAITMLGMAVLVTQYGVWVPLVLLGSALPTLYLVVRFNARMHDWWKRATPERRWTGYYEWVLTHSDFAPEIRLFDLGGHFQDVYRGLRNKLRGERLALLRRESLAQFAAGVLALLITGGVMAWMVWRAFLGQVTLGDLVLFYQAFSRGQGLMRTLMGGVGQVYTRSLFLENLYEFLDLEPNLVDPPDPHPTPSPLKDGIVFRDLRFTYPGSDRPALAGFDLTVPAGQVAAVVGPNGAGKSTLIKLLCRFYDPDEGAIELDGVDLRRLALGDLRRSITALFQTPVPYHASLRENIAFGDLRGRPAEADIERAARGAGVDEVAGKLPRGYDTLLGKWFADGTQLSTGQWQRVALARAFLRRASVIALDEPTSFMDSWAEAEWLDRFRQLATGATAIVITHRFALAARADVVHVMNEGRIVESGRPDELISGGGPFARSWAAQASGSGA